MSKRTKPKRLYVSVTEDTHQRFKRWCDEQGTTIQEQLESMVEVCLEVEEDDEI